MLKIVIASGFIGSLLLVSVRFNLSVSVSPPSSPAVPICSSSVTALSNKSAQECMLSFADAKGQ